ncbi:TonB-dependent receptor [uncultured Maribacter sp.]|uniref:SusC/RagA family TonB-linked outer membrane protein n=1 Tax=uncultured Maribacter sp. TaxID=431308 RepID=UPI0030ECCBE0|tara:strand:- start:14492 stop:17524 length:3033 start_codon:yes stop_codon:yes gene_type:complete
MKNKNEYKVLKWVFGLLRNALPILIFTFLCFNVTAQNTKVSGSVADENGSPLPGANIVEKGTTNGVTADFDGNFSIMLSSDNAALIVSYIGFSTKEVNVNDQSLLSITLSESASSLDEVVLIGYGTVKKSDLTGSVASVQGEELDIPGGGNPLQTLAGLAPGVQVSQNSGAPGGNISLRIRGGNSIMGSNEPLYVVDGFPIQGELNNLSPKDIESMEVLKDASATAIYGSRGANGVVLVTTKKGREGKTIIEIDTYVGVQRAATKLDFLNATEFANLANFRASNDGENPFFTQTEINSFGEGTDWQDEVFRDAIVKNHSISVSGGNAKTTFSLSGNYFDQEGILINSDFNRYQLRANLTHDISDRLKVSANTILSRRKANALTSDNSSRGDGVLSGALVAPPTLTVFDGDGEYTNVTPYAFSPDIADNPVAIALENKRLSTTNSVLVNLFAEYAILDNLKFKSSIGIDYEVSRGDNYSSTLLKVSATGNASISYDEASRVLNENLLSYDTSFQSDNHNLNLIAGFTTETNIQQGVVTGSAGFLNNTLENFNLQSGSNPIIPVSYYREFSLLSGLARGAYSYKGKYLLTGSIRADGSSRFGAANKWGYFPSGAVSWRISEEEFLKDSKLINNLKIRASYGKTGNTAIAPYQSLSVLSNLSAVFDNDLFVGFAPGTSKPNPNLKWETTSQTDIGLDLGLFHNRLSFTLDYYNKETNDLLASVPLPTSTGFSNSLTNIGAIENKGIDVSLDARILETEDLKWSLGLTFSRNRNKVLSLANDADIFGSTLSLPISTSVNLVRVGEPVGVFYGFIEDGLTEEGNIQYVDFDGSGDIDALDRTVIGNPNPDFIYGINSTLSYKDFDFNFLISGVQGNDLFNFNKSTVSDVFTFGLNQTTDVLGNFWTEANPDPNAQFPRVSKNTKYLASDRFVEDGSYLRLRNIQLGYDFKNVAGNIDWLNSLYLYVSAQNLFTITNYSWYSPDVSTRGNSQISPGIDQFGFPDARTFTVGLKLKL